VQLALRPYVTTGIALVGASVIAMSPISPVTPDIQVPSVNVSSAAVGLAAAINPTGDPFSAWANVAINTFENTVAIGGQVLGSGLPVLTQVLANQVGYIQSIGSSIQRTVNGLAAWPNTTLPLYLNYARDLYQAGQVGEALNWVVYGLFSWTSAFFPVLDILDIPGAMVSNLGNVMAQVKIAVMSVGLSAVGLVQDPLLALGGQVQGFINAVGAGDPFGAVNAVLNIPAVVTDAIINGYVFQGLLGAYNGTLNTGLLASLLISIPKLIADALKPPAPPASFAVVESAPDTFVSDVSSTSISELGGAGTVTVSLDSKIEATPAAETPVAETPVDETPIEETPTEETPVEQAPVDETPIEETPVDETPVDDTTGSGNGATDLSGGNKVTPGETHSDATNPGADNEDPTEPTTPTETETSPTTGGTSDEGSSNSDGGADNGSDK
jgi:hypothetical protein